MNGTMLQKEIKEIVLLEQELVSARDIMQFNRDGYSTRLKNGIFMAVR